MGDHFLFPLTLGQTLQLWLISKLPGCVSCSALHGAAQFVVPGTPQSGLSGTPLACVLGWLSLRVSSSGGGPEERSGQAAGVPCSGAQPYMQGTSEGSVYYLILYLWC